MDRRSPGSTQVLFEACVESLEETREAAAWGADRAELCVDLAHDGCTPPLSLVAACAAAGAMPVVAMVRPRPGAFVYSRAEVDAMCAAMRPLADNGAAGFATGALLDDGSIDRKATERLVAAAGGLPVTFHRAFDRIPNADDGLAALIALGVRRVLTSGGARTAEEGIDALRRLVERADGRIEVIAAGAIRPVNVETVVAGSGAPAVHARWTGWRQALDRR